MATYNHKIEVSNGSSTDIYHPETNSNQVYDFTNNKWMNEIIGTLSTLETIQKDTLVKAINAVHTGKVNKVSTVVTLTDYEQYAPIAGFGRDWSGAFDKIIQEFRTANVSGATIKIPQGTYLCSRPIPLIPYLNIVGEDSRVTIIKYIAGNTTGHEAFIDCTVDGLCMSNLKISGNFPYEQNQNVHGVYIHKADKPIGGHVFNNVYFIQFKQDGLRIDSGVWMCLFDTITSTHNGWSGVHMGGTDCTFSNVHTEGNYRHGFAMIGGNNRLVNYNAIFNSREGIDYAGYYQSSWNCQLSNIQCQDNRFHGFIFNGARNTTLSGVSSDSNGTAYLEITATNPTITANEFVFKNCFNINGTIQALNYRNTISTETGLYIDGECYNMDLKYQEYENLYLTKPQILSGLVNVEMPTTIMEKNYDIRGKTINNKMVNPLFTSNVGSATYSTFNASLTVSNGVATITSTGNDSRVQIKDTKTSGKLYYMSVKIKAPLNHQFGTSLFKDNDSAPAWHNIPGAQLTHTGTGDWQTISYLCYIKNDLSTAYFLTVAPRGTTGTSIQVKEPMTIDVTTDLGIAFGGNASKLIGTKHSVGNLLKDIPFFVGSFTNERVKHINDVKGDTFGEKIKNAMASGVKTLNLEVDGDYTLTEDVKYENITINGNGATIRTSQVDKHKIGHNAHLNNIKFIDNSTDNNNSVFMLTGSSNSSFTKCYFTTPLSHVFRLFGETNVNKDFIIQDCVFENIRTALTFYTQIDNIIMRRNEFKNITGNVVSGVGEGTTLTMTKRRFIFEDNIVHDCGRMIVEIKRTKDIIIRNNDLRQNAWYAASLIGCQDIQILSNKISTKGFEIGPETGTDYPVKDVQILNNKFNDMTGNAIALNAGTSGSYIESVLISGNYFGTSSVASLAYRGNAENIHQLVTTDNIFKNAGNVTVRGVFQNNNLYSSNQAQLVEILNNAIVRNNVLTVSPDLAESTASVMKISGNDIIIENNYIYCNAKAWSGISDVGVPRSNVTITNNRIYNGRIRAIAFTDTTTFLQVFGNILVGNTQVDGIDFQNAKSIVQSFSHGFYRHNGDPNNATPLNNAGRGSLCVDTTTGKLYVKENTTSPYWVAK